MSKVVFIKENSPAVRNKLRKAGYSICACTKYVDAIWLDYRPEMEMYRDIHGVGYADECTPSEDTMTPEQRIENWLNKVSADQEFFETVNEFLKKYPKPMK